MVQVMIIKGYFLAQINYKNNSNKLAVNSTE